MKTIFEYAARAVLATHIESLETKYLTLRTPAAALVKEGPPTALSPLFFDSEYMSAYTFAISTESRAASRSDPIETNSYCTTFWGIRMNRGEPRVAPMPMARMVQKP